MNNSGRLQMARCGLLELNMIIQTPVKRKSDGGENV
jgi:hypothetical protein